MDLKQKKRLNKATVFTTIIQSITDIFKSSINQPATKVTVEANSITKSSSELRKIGDVDDARHIALTEDTLGRQG
jgi:hypothetical protein